MTPEHKMPGYLTPSQVAAMPHEPTPEEVAVMTAVMRAADQNFEKVGGSTRHFVRECLFPALEAAGLRIVKVKP